MEGYAVLRAAALAGVPAVEVRVLANAIGEPDRERWAIDEALGAARRRPCPRSARSWRVPELPAPLPPGERTVGQVIAETIRAYGANFWRVLPLGLPIAIVDQLSVHQAAGAQMYVYWAATPLFVLAYVRACTIVHGGEPTGTALTRRRSSSTCRSRRCARSSSCRGSRGSP